MEFPQTLIQPLIQRASQTPEHPALIFISEENTETHISTGEFHQQALRYAAALEQMGLGENDLVILVLRHSQALLSAFWGAMYRGVIPAIFPFLTEKLDPNLYKERLRTLVAHSKTSVVITFPEFKNELAKLLADVDCRVLATDEVPDSAGESALDGVWQQPDAAKIAFLQHSSGTTGLQKGVALSHRAVLNQIEAYSQAIQLNGEDVIVSWLPLYHDMGLIAGFIMPLVAGIPLVLISPFHWVRDPKILLWAIHKHKGTLCWLPNFAYNHLARTARPRFLEGLDLRSWRAAINCSEPVYHQSHTLFLEKFTPYGFREEALGVSYAMAENTFAVTQSDLDAPLPLDWVEASALQEQRQAIPTQAGAYGAVSMVSCGAPIRGTEVVVLDEEGETLQQRHVGEIALRSNCMLDGYYRRPEITAEVIQDGWYRTGDMGYLAEGQLYITGRKKDLIIVGGKNIYPQDLETIANHISGIYPGRAVAFGLFVERVGSETVVMVAELLEPASEERCRQIERDLRLQVAQQTEVTLADVRLVEKRWLIKTSSGKIARNDNRQKYINEFRSEAAAV